MNRLLAAVWGVLVILYLGLWLSSALVHPYQTLLPLVIMLLSFFVFHGLAPPFRALHHGFVGLALLLITGAVYYFLSHGGEQGGVGAYLTLWFSGLVYLLFMAILLTVYFLLAASRHNRNESEEA